MVAARVRTRARLQALLLTHDRTLMRDTSRHRAFQRHLANVGARAPTSIHCVLL